MAILDPIKPQILSVRIIPNVDRGLAHKLKLSDDQRSLGLITCTIDDALYVSIDEGTKMADVAVVYAKSFYAGAAHASGPLSGEIIAIFAGAQLLAIGITGEYLARMHFRLMDRPPYVMRQRIEATSPEER